MPSRFGRLDHCCFGVSLGVEGTGSLGFRDNLVKTLLPFSSSRYIATTMVPSLSAPGRSVLPGGVKSLVPVVSEYSAECHLDLEHGFEGDHVKIRR